MQLGTWWVRGAPAIAISAALSLAVEVFNLESFDGTSSQAASFLVKKMEYLVSSRPTAVNLSDAAMKLIHVVSNASATTTKAEPVFQAFIEAAEAMLTDDVASNKAIGSYGASFIRSQLDDPKKLSVLTHCNTGRFGSDSVPLSEFLYSLATAGYELSEPNAMHGSDVVASVLLGLEPATLCLDRLPSISSTILMVQKMLTNLYKGSRLTAFELVHDKIPATLIADSAAAALMKAGRVNAVIVGADRIAANGISGFEVDIVKRNYVNYKVK
ncbi:methylthioribose-1-phosphate isomerase [Cinnamomum micranthum f. kanehirae]|uniref:Methylthioribose-1-phosphate isomerase n=1 Tax=Cinnamomum micranthum f. kanehirae TaxID=337451 RepID=A0A443NCH7_9MAGN|nr:methylthioribose-1-phosphate isomerase [Cinnamomum micranthum f. kanehirae]